MRGNTYWRAVAVLLTAAVLGLAAGTAQAAVTIITGTTGGNDSWNTASNWSAGVPTGAIDAVIAAGIAAKVQNTATPTYTGNLTLEANSTLQINWNTPKTEYWRVLGTPGSTTIYMYEGSLINMRNSGSPSMPAVQLMGNAEISMGQSTQPSASPTFGYGINGPYTLTLKGKSGCNATLTAAGTFGALVADPQWGTGWNIKANATGSLGGDVTIRAYPASNVVCANLIIGAADAMADTATLSLSGSASATKLTMNASDTIGGLFVDGVRQEAGTYGASGSGADYEVSWLAGTGILTVLGVPSAYWDLNGADPDSGSATPSGVWDAANTYWNNVADGTGSTAAWSADKTAVFAAGTDATGSYTVTVSGTQDIGGLRFEDGAVTLSGGGLQMRANSLVHVASSQTATISTTISDDGNSWQLTKGGGGTLVLSGSNTYTGVTRIEAGTLEVSALPDAGVASLIGAYPTAGADGLALVGGTLQYTGGTAVTDRGFILKGNSTIDISTPGTTLTLGNCASSDVNGTLTVTGASGSSLALGQVKIIEGSGMTLNPTSVTMTVASALGYTSYSAVSYLTLSGTTSGNVVTGDLTIENPPGSGYLQAMHVTKSGTGDWTILGDFIDYGRGCSVTVNAGTLTLLGTSSYSGATSVKGGTLIVGTDAPSNADGALGKATSDVALGLAGGNDDARLLIGGPYTVARNIRNATTNGTDAGTRVLTLGGSTADSSVFSGNVYLGTNNNTAKGVTLTAAAGGCVTFSGVIQNPTGMDTAEAAAAAAMDAVTKAGPGTVVLSGANTYTGATVVSEGRLLLANTAALSATSGVSVSAGRLIFYTGTGGTPYDVNVGAGGAGAIGLSDGAAIGGELGGTLLSTAAATTPTSGTVYVDVYASPGVTPDGSTAYTLVSAASGLDSGYALAVGNVYNNYNFTVTAANLANSSTAITVTPQPATPQTVLYWKGGYVGGNNVWALSDGGTTDTNWATDASGTGFKLVPGPMTDVMLSTTSPLSPASNMVLGAGMTIQSLTVSDPGTVALKGDGTTLTIAPASASAGIDVTASAGPVTIGANVALGASQTWTNNSTNALTVSGSVSGTSDLATGGTGAVILSGVNSHSGATTINAGTLNLSNALAVQNSTLTMGGGTAALVFDSSVAENAFTVGGLAAAASGAGYDIALQNNAGTPAAIALTVGGSADAAYAGVLSGPGSLTRTGAGTLTLSGNNTYTGGTTLAAGRLNVNAAGTDNTNSAIGTGELTLSGGTIDNTSGGAITLGTGNAVTLGGNFAFGGSNALDLGAGAADITANRTITLNGNNPLTLGPAINTKSGATTLTVNNGTGTGGSTALILGSYALTGGANTAARTTTINGTGNVTILGEVSNGQAYNNNLTKSGAGTLILSGANTYSGTTAVSAGTLRLAGSNSGGGATTVSGSGLLQVASGTALAAGNLALNGGAIEAYGETRSVGNTVTWGGNFGFAGSQDLNLTSTTAITTGGRTISVSSTGKTTISAPLTVSGNNTFNFSDGSGNVELAGNLTLNGNRTVTVNGTGVAGVLVVSGAVMQDASVRSLTKAGTGTMVLAGVNTYVGDTTVTGGVLELADNAQLTFIIGATPGTNNKITGTAGAVSLAGDFVFDLSAVPAGIAEGSSWTIVNTGSGLAMAFENSFSVVGFDDAGGDTWTKPIASSSNVWQFTESDGVLKVVLGIMPGDTNGDKVVDAADFITLKTNFGKNVGSAGASAGNFTTPDEVVDWDDLNILTNNFGAGGAGGAAPATAPEPATLGLLAIGSLLVLRRRRK